ncbi:hypothetical protein DEIGR_101023 [Deinococcus grandis]|uniref:Uncharacterized protein n=1 Tax=Deinococcus grandis TaxID=57498 RepID=A0A100HHT4_9DEIO|nr:hypothetical protein [Deinococcus grandis]BBN95516.1 hypothetical protein DEGR_22490 [Deinococcus grandis]GAQ20996.1 hypothetical protein DEIGR_101023 [Deinococcus grandis]
MAAPEALTTLNVREQWQAAFPHLQPAYDQLAADEVFSENGIPGLYFLVEGLFAPYIELLLRLPISHGRNAALHATFTFVDRLLTSPDDSVIGLGQIGIMEGREPWWFQRALPIGSPIFNRHARRVGDLGWEAATEAPPPLPVPPVTYHDLFGIRECIAQLLHAEGVTLADLPDPSDRTS